jgi:hypothetical protein
VLALFVGFGKLDLSAKRLSKKGRLKMFTFRRFGLALITMPILAVAYGAIYFGLALVANSYASAELYLSNLVALGFGWVVVVTFSKQILNAVDKIGA